LHDMTLSMGVTIILLTSKGFDPKESMEVIDMRKPTIFTCVGDKFFKEIFALPNLDSYDTRSLITIISGGAKLSADVKKRAAEVFPNSMIIDFFGQTEAAGTMGQVTMPGEKEMEATTWSKPDRSSYFDWRIVNDRGEDVKPGEIGEIVYKGYISRGYYKDSEKTAKTYKDGWFYSGDSVTIDEKGVIHPVSRVSEVINSGGEKIFPEEVEEVIHAHPKVNEVGVIGVPDPEWGESVLAVIQLKEGEKTTKEEIIEHCKQNMASFKKPRFIEFVDSLPLTEQAGKVIKASLRKKYAKKYEDMVGD